MKTILTRILLSLVLMLSTTLSAHDFSATNPDGVTIYYNQLSPTTCAATYKGHNFNNADYSGSITIPANVTYAGTTYTVTSIGEDTFNRCTSLTSISLPETLTSIGDNAFQSCTSLTSISLPDGITSIGVAAFNNCTSLTSISLPDGITSISGKAFSYCRSLTSISLPESVTSIGGYVFFGCLSLSSISLPKGVNSIGEFAFFGCTSLTSLSLPEGLTSIPDYAFSECTSLTSISLPETLTSICSFVFANCTSLTSVTNLSTTPQDIYSEDFYQVPLSKATLYVPKGSLSAYQSAPVWQDFGEIIEIDPSHLHTLTSSAPLTPTFYSINGTPATTQHPGINIIRDSNNQSKKVIIRQ